MRRGLVCFSAVFFAGQSLHRGVRFAADSHPESDRPGLGRSRAGGELSRSNDAGGWWTTRLSLVIAVIGLEISTRMVSTTWARTREGIEALAGTSEGLVSNSRFLLGLGLTALSVAVLIVASWRTSVRSRLAYASPGCPECGEATKRIRRKASHKLLSALLGDDITRRACSSCGWVGLSKDL